jgi:TatD DNase family protein
MLIDSHCHLDRLSDGSDSDTIQRYLEAARQRGVQRMLCIGTDLQNFDPMMDIIKPHDDVFASVGVHPLSGEIDSVDVEKMEQMTRHTKVIAIGETGLDYHYQPENRERQLHAFEQHLDLAVARDLPAIIHTRAAKNDTLDLLRIWEKNGLAGVLHCFTEDWEMACQALDLNFYVSFSGIITFNNAAALREVVKQVPLDRILIETDAPYLAPAPYRGQPNEPQYVKEVAQCVADTKGLSFEQVVEATGKNFFNLFKKAR